MVQDALAQNDVKALPEIRLFLHQAAENGFDGGWQLMVYFFYAVDRLFGKVEKSNILHARQGKTDRLGANPSRL